MGEIGIVINNCYDVLSNAKLIVLNNNNNNNSNNTDQHDMNVYGIVLVNINKLLLF